MVFNNVICVCIGSILITLKPFDTLVFSLGVNWINKTKVIQNKGKSSHKAYLGGNKGLILFIDSIKCNKNIIDMKKLNSKIAQGR